MDESSLEKQLAQLDERMARVERHMLWGNIMGVIRLTLIAVPIVLAFIFIPPFVKQYLPFVSDVVSTLQELTQRTKNLR